MTITLLMMMMVMMMVVDGGGYKLGRVTALIEDSPTANQHRVDSKSRRGTARSGRGWMRREARYR